MSQVKEKPNTSDEVNDPKLGHHRFAVMAFNNDKTSYQSVVGVFIVSCGYTEEVAMKFTDEIHHSGSSLCYWNSRERCKEVISDFNVIGVKAELMNL